MSGILKTSAAYRPVWNMIGHHKIGLVSAISTPRSMPSFFRDGFKSLEALAFEPDRMKDKEAGSASKFAIAPDHYLNLEPIANLDWREVKTRYALLNYYFANHISPSNGCLPFAIVENFQRLEFSLRQYLVKTGQLPNNYTGERREDILTMNEDSIRIRALFYAGLLAHFGADASQPLHTTIHHDGRVDDSGRHISKKGIHSRFESKFVDKYVATPDLIKARLKAPSRIRDVSGYAVKFVLSTNRLVQKTYDLDEAGKFSTRREDPDPEALDFTVDRLAAGSQFVLDLWVSAYEDAQA